MKRLKSLRKWVKGEKKRGARGRDFFEVMGVRGAEIWGHSPALFRGSCRSDEG